MMNRSFNSVRGYATQAKVSPPITLYSLPGKYATAAYTAALKESPKSLTQVATELSGLKASIPKNDKLLDLITNPTLSNDARVQGIEEALKFSGAKSEITKNLLSTLSENGRLASTSKVVEEFEKLISAHNGDVEVVVESAQELDSKLQSRLEATLKNSSIAAEGKKIKFVSKVNPALLGGLVVEFGEKTVDLSVASKVNKLNNLIKRDLKLIINTFVIQINLILHKYLALVSSSLMSTPAIPIQGRPRRNTVQRTPVDHDKSIEAIRTFLQSKDCLSILPVSSKMIVFDTRLQVIKALNALVQNGVVSAPLWSSVESKFAGMLTISDLVHLMQYYYATTSSYEGAADDVEQLTLGNLRGEFRLVALAWLTIQDIETAIEVLPPPLHSIHPMRPLLEACHILMTSHARRLPLIDHDDRTDVEVVLSVLTQYRVLKFIAMNCKETLGLQKTLLELNIGTYASNSDTSLEPLAVATMDTTVFDVVHQFSAKGISAVPIVDEEGAVINLYETVDVITLVRLGSYQSLDLTISSALAQRSAEFPGVITCSPKETLANVFSLIAKRRVHRLVMVEDEDKTLPNGQIRRKGALVGIVALSDILKHVIGFKDISIN
ncbi:hypothetical protein E3P78_00106 [Wallemia ichthyophaga]|nr:hypothetical protein E3P78_00106 [Wallemia ichthyophaga]